MSMTLVVLAAGIGSRYGGLKQMDEVGPSGEAVIDYALYDAMQAGFDKIVFIIRQSFADDFQKAFGNGVGKDIEKQYVYQELDLLPEPYSLPAEREKPWGTGHAVWACRNTVKEPFAVINADDFYGRASYEVAAGHLKDIDPASSDWGLIGFMLRNTLSPNGHVARGICSVDDSGRLTDIVERIKIVPDGDAAKFEEDDGSWSPLAGDEDCSMNFWAFTPTVFDQLDKGLHEYLGSNLQEHKKEYLLPTAVDGFMKSGAAVVEVLETPAKWFGITYRDDKDTTVKSISQLVDEGVYPSNVKF